MAPHGRYKLLFLNRKLNYLGFREVWRRTRQVARGEVPQGEDTAVVETFCSSIKTLN